MVAGARGQTTQSALSHVATVHKQGNDSVVVPIQYIMDHFVEL